MQEPLGSAEDVGHAPPGKGPHELGITEHRFGLVLGASVSGQEQVYAKCIDGQDQIAKRRIEDALRDPGEPAQETPQMPEEGDAP